MVWGGLGGRVAMRVVFLTSDDRVRGVISDDGFEIGRITFQTIDLLVTATLLGVVGGLTYGLIRIVLRGPRPSCTWMRTRERCNQQGRRTLVEGYFHQQIA